MKEINTTEIATTTNAILAISEIKDVELRNKSMQIVSYMNSARNSLFYVAKTLNDIKTNKLYEKAGFKKFNDFCEDVLGYKHAMCNNLVRIAERFLDVNEKGEIASIIVHDGDCDYTVSQLQEVLKVDNDIVIEMDENGEISPDMTTKEIRKAVKARTTEETADSNEETTESNEEIADGGEDTENNAETPFEHLIASISNGLDELLNTEVIRSNPGSVKKIDTFKTWLDKLV